MKDEKDNSTVDFIASASASKQTATPAAHAAALPSALPPVRRVKQFDVIHAVMDNKMLGEPKPKCARTVLAFGFEGGHFVPVLFAAKDWKVTPRRIRALLSGGRLAGRLQDNGYWEVRFPYSFTFGTRGPSLKRQQKQERRAA